MVFYACKPTSSTILYGNYHHYHPFSFSLSWDCFAFLLALYICGQLLWFHYLTSHDPSFSILSLARSILTLSHFPSSSSSFFFLTSSITHTNNHIDRYIVHLHTQSQRFSEFNFELVTEKFFVWMDPSSGQHQQMSSHHQSLENMIASSKVQQQQQQDKKPRPQPEQALKCPRCDSTNTKFCYYNNYSLSQPRYFCKSCRRYWTKGGTLRNVPVGGGCRKNKRSSSSSSTSSASSKRGQDQGFTPNSNPLTGFPHLSYDSSSDLTLALARLQKQTSVGGLGFDDHDLSILGNPTSSLCDILGNNHHHGLNSHHNSTNAHAAGGFLEALRSGFQVTQNNNNNHNSFHHQNENLYYSYGNGDMEEVVDNGNSYGEMMVPNYDNEMSNAATQAVSVTTMKQELFGGIPWHHLSNHNNGDTNMGELDSARSASWNHNGFTSNWQGLLHSPLM